MNIKVKFAVSAWIAAAAVTPAQQPPASAVEGRAAAVGVGVAEVRALCPLPLSTKNRRYCRPI